MKHSVRHALAIGIAAATLLLAVMAGIPQKSSAGSLTTAVIGMFPRQVGEFAYADLKTARKYPWFGQLREQLLPKKFREFEKFLATAGVDSNTVVDEVAWGGFPTKDGGEDVMGVALGSFNPSSSEDRFKQQKLPMVDVHGYHLYAFGNGSGGGDILFTFIDVNTAAFGSRPALEKMIDVRTGVAPSLMTDDTLFPLINQTNGNGIVWAVLDQSNTHLAMQELVPQAGDFPQAAAIVNRLRAMTIIATADKNLDMQFVAVCGSTDDANLLGAALQAGIMMRRYQASQGNNPDLAGALDHITVVPAGDHLRVDFPVSQDQLLTLIRDRTFAVPM
jgi:hypothetical protein